MCEISVQHVVFGTHCSSSHLVGLRGNLAFDGLCCRLVDGRGTEQSKTSWLVLIALLK